jgi:serine/threonine-protein kinase
MENLDGETLADRLLRTESVPWASACEIARQVAEAIAAAHANGIVHRDLKPENVFLVRDPADPAVVASVKVLDFGIAKLLAADASARLTMRGIALGTPEYMAPEQCAGADEIDERADIYALGCILFEMLSGEPPFIAESVQELFALHMFRPAPAIGERVAGLPDWVAGLVTIMLAKKREERPASMRRVARTLGEKMEAARTAGRPATSRWGGPRAASLVAAVVAILGVSALIAVWNTSRSNGLPTHARPLEAAASGGSPEIAPEAAFAPPRPIVIPAAPAVPIPPAGAAPASRQPARTGERPSRSVPPRAAKPKPKHGGSTDGIVDL